ncbi:MAG: S8 family serine peptidase [Pseudobacteriovorax sp.]|nr:S8 family serine peptidase [Pseudobacteriovorax sp.]
MNKMTIGKHCRVMMTVLLISSAGESRSEEEKTSNKNPIEVSKSIQLPQNLMAIENSNWGLKTTRMLYGWQMLEAKGKMPGEGVTIVLADTGISPHPELLAHNNYPSPIRMDLALDTVDDDNFPDHNFEAINLIPRHGHGTETASVIVSPPGCPSTFKNLCVTGASPAAQLVPVRVSDSVVLSFGRRLAKGIDHAITINADIIAIPMGGIGPMNQLRDAIRRANAAGIIVIVAASNFTGPLRIVPAFWDETITVGAINDRLKPWVGSAFGRWVDLSAPGVNINHARTEKRDNEIVYEVKLAQGTSDATALVAGAAALWISYHGKDKLIERFGLDQIPTIFRKLLKEHGVSTPKGFPSKRYGSGVLDVVKLLEAPLPTNTKSQKKM